MLNRIISAIAAAVFFSVAALAQFELGSAVGTVKDPSGLSMPGVTVEIRSLATNVARTTTTS
jgi:hypothetical protein